MDFTGGCESVVFHKVGAVSPPWGGILLNYTFCGNGWNFSTFHEYGLILHHFQLRGVKMVPGGPGAETSTKPRLFLCIFRGSGHPKVGSGVDFQQKKQLRVLF